MDKSLNQWLATLAGRWGLTEELARQAAVFAWSEAVGERLAKLARPLYVQGNTLHLAVASHVAAAELRLLSGKLLARLWEALPGCGVESLKFHVYPQPSPSPKLQVPEPSEADWRAAEEDIPADLSGELRDRLVRIGAWARARDRALLSAGGKRCPRCGVVYRGEGDLCPVCSLVTGPEGE